jgi:hypothetical protein
MVRDILPDKHDGIIIISLAPSLIDNALQLEDLHMETLFTQLEEEVADDGGALNETQGSMVKVLPV